MSVHVPGFVVEPEYSFLNLSRNQSCHGPSASGSYTKTVNVIDLVISEATLDEPVISTPVWINPSTSFPSICVCHVLCREEVLQGLSRTSCNSLIPSIRKKPRGLACATRAWPTRQELHRADEPIMVQSSSSHQPWILQPRLRPQKCSQGKPLKQGYNWKSSSSFGILKRSGLQARSVQLGSIQDINIE